MDTELDQKNRIGVGGQRNRRERAWWRGSLRSREGLQLALSRMLGREGVPVDVVALISALPEWHYLWLAEDKQD